MLMFYLTSDPGIAWDIPPIPTIVIALAAIVYLRGWFRIRRTRPLEFPVWRAYMLISGLIVLFLALASPVDTLADRLLLLHMTQHILLMSVVPPLIVLAAPVVPMLRGFPKWGIKKIVGPLLRWRALHRVARKIAAPIPALLLMAFAFLLWHIPAAYELALRSEPWHNIEHLCFFSTSLLFWWKIIEPWPARNPWSPWAKLACLFAADVINTAVSAFLCFCGTVVYPSYDRALPLFGMTALSDQSAAGAAMWVTNSIAFLIPAMIIPLKALAPAFTRRRTA